MQEVTFFDKPSPHIIIDNFLEPRQARHCLEEAIRLEPFYEEAGVAGDEHLVKDHCEECKRLWEINRNVTRQNDVIYMDKVYQNKRQHSKILEYLHQEITKNSFQDLMDKKGFFHLFRHVNNSEAILSRYGKCDFYGWHTDTLPNKRTARLITLCYYFNEEPERFKGGDLVITGDTIHDFIKVKPKHNRAIIFQSDTTVHAVDTIDLPPEDFKGGRFSVNFWLGMSGGHEFR